MTASQSTLILTAGQVGIACFCAHCGRGFRTFRSRIREGHPNYCSRHCSVAARTTPEAIARRFWAKVCKDKVSGCWVWQGKQSDYGHGQFRLAPSQGGQMVVAHRFAYELLIGPIPDDILVLHNCPMGDNPACVNPAHLFLGDHAENMRDMVRKGRSTKGRTRNPADFARGERHHNAKISDRQAQEIRIDRAAGVAVRKLAMRFNVSTVTIYAILKDRNRGITLGQSAVAA